MRHHICQLFLGPAFSGTRGIVLMISFHVGPLALMISTRDVIIAYVRKIDNRHLSTTLPTCFHWRLVWSSILRPSISSRIKCRSSATESGISTQFCLKSSLLLPGMPSTSVAWFVNSLRVHSVVDESWNSVESGGDWSSSSWYMQVIWASQRRNIACTQ